MPGEFVKHHEISDRIRDGDRTDVMACLLIEWVGDLGELISQMVHGDGGSRLW